LKAGRAGSLWAVFLRAERYYGGKLESIEGMLGMARIPV
jgi:hypothetical protein